MRKTIQVISRQFSSIKHPEDLKKIKELKIELQKFEFEPFKFNIERQNLIHGYTMEELYGRYYGLKHSPLIKKEMMKDNIVAIGIIFATLLILWDYSNRDAFEEKQWKNYYYSELPNVRNNISN